MRERAMTKAVSKPTKPEPVPIMIECSICGEDWDEHPADPTVMDCVEILKSKNKIANCCGHGHECCHHWHYHWWTQPYYINTAPIVQTWDSTTNRYHQVTGSALGMSSIVTGL